MARKKQIATAVVADIVVTPADLISEYNKISQYIEGESKRFAEFIKPYNDRREAISNQLLAQLNEQNCESFKTDYGTAYKSHIMRPKAADREKFLDFVLDDWDNRGDMLQIGAPQVNSIRHWMDTHNGDLPPGVEISTIVRVNIKPS